MNRYLIIIHGFFLLVSIAIRLFLTGPLFSAGTDFENTKIMLPLALFAIIYIMVITAAAFATAAVITVRFYKNLFSNQGYLTHTLPVTSGQHLLSKTISGSIWAILNILLTAASLWIVVATPFITDAWSANLPAIREELGFTGAYAGMSWGTVIAIVMAMMLFGSVSSVITYYASIVIGQLIPNHKILGAVAAYFVITTVASIITLIFLAVTGLFGASISPSQSFAGISYFINTAVLSGGLSLVFGVILYIASYWIMKKRINLD